MTEPSSRLQLKIALDGFEPLIWRRVVVDDSLTFLQLHNVIQAAMGWENYHMHEFELSRNQRVGTNHGGGFMDFGPEPGLLSERNTRLADVLEGKRKFRYWYDFGDDWWHIVSVEKRLPADPDAKPAVLVAGANACPPEDCGGIYGYADLLDALADPAHESHDELREWIGGDFDPAFFDLDAHAKRVAGAVRKRKQAKGGAAG